MYKILIEQLITNYKHFGKSFTDVGDLRQIGKTTALVEIASQMKKLNDMKAAIMLIGVTKHTPVVVVCNTRFKNSLKKKHPEIEFATIDDMSLFVGCRNLVFAC